MSTLMMAKQAANPNAPAANKVKLFFDNNTIPVPRLIDENGVVRYIDDGRILRNASVAQVAAGYSSDTYLAGSSIVIPAPGAWRAGAQYHCIFDMTKTGAGTAAFTVNVRMGTLGTTGDASVLSLAFAVGTAAIDSGIFELNANFRTVGSGTSAVIAAMIQCSHHLAATGLITTGASGGGIVFGTSSGFASTTQTIIGLSVNGGASFSGTNTIVQADVQGL